MKERNWMRRRVYLVVIPLAILCWGWVAFHMASSHFWGEARPQRSLFSWSSEPLTGEGRQRLFSLMDTMELNTLYQWISDGTETSVITDFLREAEKQDISVWILTGDPAWGLDPTGASMIEKIEQVAAYQEDLSEIAGFQGVMMDCEPYLTDAWDKEPELVLESWCSAMAAAREKAHDHGLQFFACIPYYLDTSGFTPYLDRMVHTGCDGLAIMNYYKKNEAAHIETEVQLAASAGIPVVVIYELQPPGVAGLQEVNTYYSDGLDALERSWETLCSQFEENTISLAFHEYNALREVLGIE